MNAQLHAAIPLGAAANQNTGSAWKSVYSTGAAAAVLSAVFFPIQIAAIVISPPPGTVTGWFTLLHDRPLMGLLNLDLLLICDQVLAMLVFLALYVALKRLHESAMAVGTLLAMASAVLFIAANPAVGMLSLSSQYAAAGSEAQRAVIAAAGQGLLATWQGSAFQTSYILGSIASIIISMVMLRSDLFHKPAAIMGILANTLALGLYVPVIGTAISIFSVVFLWIWYLMIAIPLFRLGKTG